MDEKIIEERHEPGIDLIELHGAPGYQMEHLLILNSSSNGLRLEIMDTGEDRDEDSNGWWCFHIKSADTARLIAKKLLEFSECMDNPGTAPRPADPGQQTSG